jgi:hypothetical protein
MAYKFNPLTGGLDYYEDGVSTNTGNRLVLRDASGNFSAGAITADTSIILPLGSTSSGSLQFSSDANTGLYSSGADAIDIIAGSYVGLQIKKSEVLQVHLINI